jgi:hypothetical protein
MPKFLERKKFFEKILENFQPSPTEEKIEISQRRRETHRLTPLKASIFFSFLLHRRVRFVTK